MSLPGSGRRPLSGGGGHKTCECVWECIRHRLAAAGHEGHKVAALQCWHVVYICKSGFSSLQQLLSVWTLLESLMRSLKSVRGIAQAIAKIKFTQQISG